MTWNYRVLEHEEGFAIHDVFYNKNNKPESYGTDPVYLGWYDNCEDLKSDLNLILKALDKPVLKYSDFEILED
jgi:hypothetical protein